MLLQKWTPTLIRTALDTCTVLQRNALELYAEIQHFKNQTPGPKRLASYAFDSVAEYASSLSSAKENVKFFFSLLGVTRVDDLEFDEQAKSSDGRLYANPQLKPDRAFADES